MPTGSTGDNHSPLEAPQIPPIDAERFGAGGP